MLTFTTPELRNIVKSSTDDPSVAQAVDNINFLEFSELEQSVREDVTYLKESPLVLPETELSGWVYEVGTGKVNPFIPLALTQLLILMQRLGSPSCLDL